MLPGLLSSDGALFVTETEPQPTSSYVHGIAVNAAGSVHIGVLMPYPNFVGGFSVSDTGKLAVAYGELLLDITKVFL